MSTYTATVVEVKMEPHPNADALSVMQLESGNVVVLRTQDWEEGQLAVHIEPDYEVNVTHPAFSWLAVEKNGKRRSDWERVKPVKLRGIKSYGLLVPVSELFGGDVLRLPVDGNLFEELNQRGILRRWKPPVNMRTGNATKGPSGVIAPKYDVENYYKYVKHFVEGEEVVATEKLHGSNGRYLWDGEKFHCGSRNQWKAESEDDPWWRALNNTPALKSFLKANKGVVVYGEVYGNNPGFRYGMSNGRLRFAIFDMLLQTSTGPQWADWEVLEEVKRKFRVPFTPEVMWVPVVYKGPFDLELMKSLAEGSTLMPNSNGEEIREGIVVRPVKERTFGPNFERLQVKFVSDEYLEKS